MVAYKQLLMRTGLFFFLGFIGLTAFGQEQQALRKVQKKKLDSDWSINRTIKSISNNRDTCEAWVRRLKEKQVETEDHKQRYVQVKQAYDFLLDQMIQDISEINNMAELYQFIASSNDRTYGYKRECMYADRLCVEFINASFLTLHGDIFTSQAFAMNAWLDFFIPGFVSRISDMFREAIKNYYIKKLNGLRFYGWEKVI
jgi:hypothetical protein